MEGLESGGSVATLDAPDIQDTSTETAAPGAPSQDTPPAVQTGETPATPADPTETPAAESLNPALARENALIGQFFGFSDADLAEFTDGARAKLLQQAEARLMDQFIGGKTPAAPEAPQAPQAHAAPNQPQAGVFDLKPLLKELEATDPELAPHIGKAMQAMVDHFAPQFNRLAQMEAAIGQMAPSWQQASQFQQQQAVESFYGNLVQTEPGWKAILDGPQGQQIKQQGYQIGEQLVRNNPNMDHGQALKMGLLQASKMPLAQIAMKHVQSTVQRRGKSITTPPGTAASRGASAVSENKPQSARERMLAAVNRTAEAKGIEIPD